MHFSKIQNIFAVSNKNYTIMVTVKYVLAITKCNTERIESVEFSSRVDNLCLCTVSLKDRVEHIPALESDNLVELTNKFIYKCHALLLPGKDKYTLTLMFPVKL